jgi:hypothetical protein
VGSTLLAWALVLAVAALGLVGCERDYVYRPTVATTSAVSGRPASYYEVPPGAPRGFVQLTTFGLTEIQPQSGSDEERAAALHVRMVVANNSDTPWTVDTREQLLALPGLGNSRPAFATADQGAAPMVVIPPNGKRTIDLFYPLPEDMQSANDIPAFDTIWKVQAGDRVVAERTPFERLEVHARYAYDEGYDGWGNAYWYDPSYARGAFVGVRVVPVYVHRPVMIRSHPVAPRARRSR